MRIPTPSRLAWLTLPIALAAASLTCGGDSLTLPDEGVPAAIQPLEGDNQTGPVASPLPDSVVVRVTDSKDRPVVGARIAFVPTVGDGDALPDTSETDADGRAGARWILGETAGAQRIEARVVGGGVDGPLVRAFNATAVAGAADTVFLVSGNGQSGTVGSALADSLVVRVTDAYGNVVSGSNVTWAPTGGGSVSPAGTTTGTNGQAATRRTLGLTAGAQGATATAAGLKGSPVSFTHSATAGAAAALAMQTQPSSAAQSGVAFATQPALRLVDLQGNLVAQDGVTVTAALATGSGTLGGTLTANTAGGVATFTNLSITGPSGSYTLRFTATGLTQVTSGTITLGAGTAAKLVVVTQPSDTAQNAIVFPTQPTVQVQDAAGNPVSGVRSVSVTIASGGGVLGGTSPVNTNASGLATFTGLKVTGTVGVRTLRFQSAGLTDAVSDNIVLVAGAPTQIAINGGNNQSATAGSAVAVDPSVILRDVSNNPVPNVGVTFAVTSGGGSVTPTTAVQTNASGIAAVSSWTLGVIAGTNTLSATAAPGGISGNPVGFTATGTAGSAGKLVITVQPPASAQSGINLTTSPVVQLQDVNGNPVTTSGIAITAAIASGPGPSSLGGTTTEATVNGLATFDNIRITGPVGSYTLAFSGTNLTGTPPSNVITLTAGTATKLAIVTQPPATAQSGVAFTRDPQVQVQDGAGNPVGCGLCSVTVSISSGGGTLGGTATRATNASGVVTFPGLSISGTVGSRTLLFASGGLTSVVSAPIELEPGLPDHLIFGQQPTAVIAGQVITPSPTVIIRDASNNTVATATNTITMVILDNPGSATLGGDNAVAAVNGTATFGDLTLDKAGTGYTLRATSGSLTGVTSNAFNVAAGTATKLAMFGQPSGTAQSGAVFGAQPIIQLQDALGNPVAQSGVTVTAEIGSGPGTLFGDAGKTTDSQGRATFTDLGISGTVGSYTLHFTAGILTPVNSGTITLSAGSAAQLAFTVQPSDANVGGTITPAVEVEIQDGAGNLVTSATTSVTVALANNPTGANLGGTKTVSAVGGLATFSTLTVDKTGTGYTLSATATSLAADESAGFDIAAAATTTAITSDSPDPSVVGEAVTVNFTVTSSGGTPTGTVTVSDGVDSCIGTVAAGTCGLTLTTIGVGTLTATYAGDGNFTGSADTEPHTVNQAATTTTITSDDPDPSNVDEVITVSWTVTVNAPGAGTPTGSVTVTATDGLESCSAAVENGSCSFSLTTSGARNLVATYAGDSRFLTSASSGTDHTVN
ncbi:MAG TPA: Ig-like domain repeat protein [Gemmatimonadales bacterium]|nr:Ig-like domain repeat protein [Gemmatimonadales bacterium]